MNQTLKLMEPELFEKKIAIFTTTFLSQFIENIFFKKRMKMY